MTHTKRKRQARFSSSSEGEEGGMDFLRNFKEALKDKEVQTLLGKIFKDNVIQTLIMENEKLNQTVKLLENRLNEQEQYSRRTCIKVSGITEKNGEDTDKIVLELAKDIGIDLKAEEISRSHRLPNRQNRSPRDIVVRFTTYNKRQKILKARKNLRNKRDHIYINEHLTKQRSDLAYNARKLKKEGLIDDTWTMDGKIFVKTSRNGQTYINGITHQDELCRYQKKVSTSNENQRKPPNADRLINSPRLTLPQAMAVLSEEENLK